MTQQNEFLEQVSRLMRLNRELLELDGNPYLHRLTAATTTCEWYDVVLALHGGASSKELRDTSDRRVHALLDQICHLIGHLNTIFNARFFATTAVQQLAWLQSAGRDPIGKYALRSDGSIEIGVLDSMLRGSTLHVGRVFNGSYSGQRVAFELELAEAQRAPLEAQFANVKALRAALDAVLPIVHA